MRVVFNEIDHPFQVDSFGIDAPDLPVDHSVFINIQKSSKLLHLKIIIHPDFTNEIAQTMDFERISVVEKMLRNGCNYLICI